jgi:hypothetical protein
MVGRSSRVEERRRRQSLLLYRFRLGWAQRLEVGRKIEGHAE